MSTWQPPAYLFSVWGRIEYDWRAVGGAHEPEEGMGDYRRLH